jgi:hypothetical protein
MIDRMSEDMMNITDFDRKDLDFGFRTALEALATHPETGEPVIGHVMYLVAETIDGHRWVQYFDQESFDVKNMEDGTPFLVQVKELHDIEPRAEDAIADLYEGAGLGDQWLYDPVYGSTAYSTYEENTLDEILRDHYGDFGC